MNMRLSVVDVAEPGGLWSRLWAVDPYQHPSYQPAELRAGAHRRPSLYYLPDELRPPAAGRSGSSYTQHSLVAHDAEGPVAGLVLTVEGNGGLAYLSSYGRPIYVAEAPAASAPRRRTAARLLHRALGDLRDQHSCQPYQLRDFVHGGRLHPLTELLLRDGARVLPYFVQTIDLSSTPEEILASSRSTTRNLLRRGRPGLDVDVVTAQDVTGEHLAAFRALYVGYHGRDSRTPEAWAAMLDCVRANEAFFVFGREDGRYVSAAYFAVSARYCHYTNAVNDRSRYGNGLSHPVVWQAVLHARERGCRWFELGERLYPAQHAGLVEKYHTISQFKAAFGSDVTTRLDVFAPGAQATSNETMFTARSSCSRTSS
jgi:hypothetical protein